MEIGKRIKEIREKAGLSQTELAKVFGMSKAQLSQYETGKRTPKLTTLFKMEECIEGFLMEVSFNGISDKMLITHIEKLKEDFHSLIMDVFSSPRYWKPLIDSTDSENDDPDTIRENEHHRTFVMTHSAYNEEDLIGLYRKLNATGKEKVLKYAEDIAENPKYRE